MRLTSIKIPMKKYLFIVLLSLLQNFIYAQQAKLTLPIGHTDDIIDYRITPNNNYLVTASKDGTGKIWNYRTGKFMYDLKLHLKKITGIEMSKDGSFVVLSSTDGTFSKWEIESGELLFHSSKKAAINEMFLLAGDTTILIVTNYEVIISSLSESEEILIDGYSESYTRKIAVSPDEKSIAIFTERRGLGIYSLPDGKEKGYTNEIKVDSVQYINLSEVLPDFLYFTNSNELVYSVNGRLMAGFNIENKKQTFYYPAQNGRLLESKFNKNRTLMAFMDNDYDEIKIWNTTQKKMIALIPNQKRLTILKFSDLNSNLILCNSEIVQEWSTDGKLLFERRLEEEIPFELLAKKSGLHKSILNNEETIINAINKDVLQTISWKTGKLINEFSGKIGSIKKSLVSKNGKWLFEIKKNYSNYWNLNTLTATRFPNYDEDVVNNIFLTASDNQVLLQYENLVSLFDCSSGEIIYTKPIDPYSNILMLQSGDAYLTFKTWKNINTYKDTTYVKRKFLINGEPNREWIFPGNVANAAISNSGNLLAYNISNINEDSIFIWDIENNRKLISFFREAQYVANPIAGYYLKYTPDFHFSNDNKYVFYSEGNNGFLSIAKLPSINYSIKQNVPDSISEPEIVHKEIFEYFSKEIPINLIHNKNIVQLTTRNEGSDESEILAYNYSTSKELFRLPSYQEFQRIMFFDSIKNQLYTATNTEWLLWDLNKKRLINNWEIPPAMKAESVILQNQAFLISSNDRIGIQFMDGEKPVYFFSTLDNDEAIASNEDGYYKVTPNAAINLSWNIENKFYDFDQWDIQYNRPDKVLAGINSENKQLITAYKNAYLKRLKKYGLTETNVSNQEQLPQCIILNKLTDGDVIVDSIFNLKLKIIPTQNVDTKKILILVNGCPVFGREGYNKIIKNGEVFEIPIKLNNGLNSFKISCIDINNVESLREQFHIFHNASINNPPKLHFLGIGINQFANPDYNLSWSVKDIGDLAIKLKSKYPNIIIDTLFDKNVTKENILALKQKLLQLNEDDKVIVSYSGHGVLSKDFDYFLSTYSIDFTKPEENGFAYEDLENLLDNIKPRQKLMLIDACHSGEVDKEELDRVEASKKVLDNSGIVHKSSIKVVKKKNLGMANSFELMQSLFVNVGKGTGATIISAAGGMQYAQERGDLKNGVFTYSIIEAMNNNSTLKVSELKKMVGERVIQLTNGLQKPTSRNETNNYDWVIW